MRRLEGDEGEGLDARSVGEGTVRVDVRPVRPIPEEEVGCSGGRLTRDEDLVLIVVVGRDGRGGTGEVSRSAETGPGRVLEVPAGDVAGFGVEDEAAGGEEVLGLGLFIVRDRQLECSRREKRREKKGDALLQSQSIRRRPRGPSPFPTTAPSLCPRGKQIGRRALQRLRTLPRRGSARRNRAVDGSR